MGGFGRGFGGYYPGGYGIWYGGFSGILFLILIGVVVYLLIKRNKNVNYLTKQDVSYNNNALEVAKLRYVRGEISFDEYQQIVKTLK
ncbi:hypothetical protein BHF71_10715 [Vulcanibacillus modesticaldus]|uniref:SHOCT domain-containing protein n=2 Tax=Vulcanibacillus modesticaldus TaxID=337097 RepID=A0A1D2YT51_9BACI|nr:hypothetical protein BHF71_10715 [Vulcanibacillus modesticaldus]